MRSKWCTDFLFFLLSIHRVYCVDDSCTYHKFSIRILLGTPPPIFAIFINIILIFLDTPVFKVGKYINITPFGLLHFSVSVGLVYISSSSLGCYKDRSFYLSNLYIQVVSTRIFPYFGSVFVHYFF